MLRPDRGARAASPQPLRAVSGARGPLELLPAPPDPLVGFIERRVRSTGDDEEVGSIVCFELDRVDELADEHGDRFRDRVADALGSIIEGSFRSTDPVTRRGLGRFAVVVEGAPIGEAARRAERVRLEVQATRFDGPRGEPVWVSASAGCAAIGRDEDAIPTALEAAESALAAAARAGRNRVIASR